MSAPRKSDVSWRDVFPIHPAAELLPRLSEDELDELAKDIKTHGMLNPIIIWSTRDNDDKREFLLDGRHRLDAAAQAGVLSVTEQGTLTLHRNGAVEDVKKKYYYGADPYALALSLNVRRRHLTAEQKREVVAKLLEAKPEQSNRQIAKTVGVDDKTVASVRREKESRSEIPNVAKTTDTKGRKQPLRKPRLSPEQQSAGQPQNTETVTVAVSAASVPAVEIETTNPTEAAPPKPTTARRWMTSRVGCSICAVLPSVPSARPPKSRGEAA